MKQAKNIISLNIIRVMPMIEEISKAGLMPLCVIGFDKPVGNTIPAIFSTADKGHDESVYLLCKNFVEQYEAGTLKKL